METAISNTNISNLTEYISEALASTTSTLIGAAASAASAAAESTSSATLFSESVFDVTIQRLPQLFRSPKVFLAGTRRMAANLDVTSLCFLVGFIFVFCLYLIHLIALVYAKYRLHRKVLPDSSLPGVSVIKPIVGVDKNLRSNIETFFTSKYHKFEILFCFNSEKDPAVEIVKSLIEKYPKIDTSLFFKGECVGLNPKINNMMPAYRAAKYPLLLISDSGMCMRSDAILDMATTIMSKEKIALVTQVPYCKDRGGYEAAIEQIYFGTSHGRIYLAGNCMEFVCSTGMSSMMKKEALEDCGGIAAFGGYLAEDYFFGRELASRGYKSAISTHPALQNGGSPSISSFFDRICRWIKLRIAMLPHIILVEPLQDCFPSGIIMSFSMQHLFGASPLVVFSSHLLLWIAFDYLLMNSIQNGDLCFSLLEFVPLWLIRELSAPFIFLRALCEPTIRWRNNVFKLAWGGRIMQK